MKKNWMAHAALVLLMAAGSAWADDASIKKLLKERFPELPVQSVKPAPMAGWYEIFSGNRLFYVDEKADFIFVGSVVEAKTKRNLTEERVRDLMRVKFDILPFDDAIKIVKGDGSRKLAVFEDPDCPYCKRVEADIAKVDNLTLYVFLYPIEQLHADATAKSQKVWCAKDRGKAWHDLMLKNQVPKNKGDCETPIGRNIALANQLNINGTPALIFEDGRLAPGAIPKEQIEKFLSEATANKAEAKAKPKEADKK